MAKIRPLAPELALVARTELNEQESTIVQDLEALRTWISKQPHLRARTDDQFLVAFLRFCKFSLELTKQRIDYYYTYKTTTTDLLESRLVDDKLLEVCRSGLFAVLPNPVGPGGPRIHWTRMGNIDTSRFNVRDIFRVNVTRSEIQVNKDDNWVISGVLEVIDFSSIPFAFLKQFEPSLFRKMAAFLEYGVPTNLKGTHIINASKEAQLILGLVRNLMKQKELLHIHPNIESLHKFIAPEYLPVDFGGKNGTLDEAVADLEKTVLEYKTYFEEDVKYGVDEKLRPDNSSNKSVDNVGSFRKLDID